MIVIDTADNKKRFQRSGVAECNRENIRWLLRSAGNKEECEYGPFQKDTGLNFSSEHLLRY